MCFIPQFLVFMLISLGFDVITILTDHDSIQLERNDVEYRLGPCVIDLLPQDHEESIYVINWPGSFTHIRLWCLVLNTLSVLPHSRLKLFNVDKLSFYRYFVAKWFLPSLSYIFIGQKRFCRQYDFTNNNKKLIAIDTIAHNSGDFFCDPIGQWPLSTHDHFVSLVSMDGKVGVYFRWKQTTDSPNTIWFTPSTVLAPDYMIEPHIN